VCEGAGVVLARGLIYPCAPMSTEPLTFLKDTFPSLFAKGVERLRSKAAGGDARAKTKLQDVEGATGAVFLEVEGEGEVYLELENGQMKVLQTKPDDAKVRLAVAAPGEAMRMLLGEAHAAGELEEEKAAKRAVGTASKNLQEALGADSLQFHVIVEDVPDVGTVTVRVGLNAAQPPAQPKFSATIKFDDLEAARSGELNPQMLFMSGKLRMSGDYSRALQLAMQLMQKAQAGQL